MPHSSVPNPQFADIFRASRLAALLLPHIVPACSVVARCDPGAALRKISHRTSGPEHKSTYLDFEDEWADSEGRKTNRRGAGVDTAGLSTVIKDQIAERGARTPPHGAHDAPRGPRPKRRDDRAPGPPPCVVCTVGWQYREYLRELTARRMTRRPPRRRCRTVRPTPAVQRSLLSGARSPRGSLTRIVLGAPHCCCEHAEQIHDSSTVHRTGSLGGG